MILYKIFSCFIAVDIDVLCRVVTYMHFSTYYVYVLYNIYLESLLSHVKWISTNFSYRRQNIEPKSLLNIKFIPRRVNERYVYRDAI